jgi:hypothetical protein
LALIQSVPSHDVAIDVFRSSDNGCRTFVPHLSVPLVRGTRSNPPWSLTTYHTRACAPYHKPIPCPHFTIEFSSLIMSLRAGLFPPTHSLSPHTCTFHHPQSTPRIHALHRPSPRRNIPHLRAPHSLAHSLLLVLLLTLSRSRFRFRFSALSRGSWLCFADRIIGCIHVIL